MGLIKMFKKSLFKSYFDDELDSNLNRVKFIQGRIKMVKKYIPKFGNALNDYIDKMAKSRDCGDKVAVILNEYAKAENVTTAFKLHLGDFASIVLDVGTKRDAQIHVMETKVLEQLGEYEKLCRHIQNELKIFIIAKSKEKNWRKQLKRVKASQLQDQDQVTLSEEEFIKARGESVRSSKNLEEQIDIFEKKRLSGIKEGLLAWTLAELHFHAKALELFTDAYRIAANIEVNDDLEEFRSKLRSTDDRPRSDSKLHVISLPFRRKTKFTGRGIPHSSSAPTSSRSSQISNNDLNCKISAGKQHLIGILSKTSSSTN